MFENQHLELIQGIIDILAGLHNCVQKLQGGVHTLFGIFSCH